MTINDIQHQIIDDMAALEAKLDKYAYVIEQGKHLEPLDDLLKVEAHAIKGCQSQVPGLDLR